MDPQACKNKLPCKKLANKWHTFLFYTSFSNAIQAIEAIEAVGSLKITLAGKQ